LLRRIPALKRRAILTSSPWDETPQVATPVAGDQHHHPKEVTASAVLRLGMDFKRTVVDVTAPGAKVSMSLGRIA